jgi:hypothetical protein
MVTDLLCKSTFPSLQTTRTFTNRVHNSQELKVLPVRDPVKRTKAAYIDMVTRAAAIRASYMTGDIFGLLLDIKLAVEDEN